MIFIYVYARRALCVACYLHYSFQWFICASYLTCRSEENVKPVNARVADTDGDANTPVCRARARKRKRKRRSKSWDGLHGEIPEVLARRFQAQNDPPLISAGVLFAIFITMSTSSPLFRESCATPSELFARFPTPPKSVSRPFHLFRFFINFCNGTDLLLINVFRSSALTLVYSFVA